MSVEEHRATGNKASNGWPSGRDNEEKQGGFKSGALSSGRKPGYHLVPFDIFLVRLAVRYTDGATRYGEDNWKKGLGDRDYVLDRANHTIEHLLRAIRDIKLGVAGSDDDLAAVIWGAIFLMGAQVELGILTKETETWPKNTTIGS